MLAAAIQKEYAIVYFTQSKIENPILSFLIWNFDIESIKFSKEKEFSNEFDDWHSNVWLFFLLFAGGKSYEKKEKASKKVVQWKSFLL